MVGEILNKDPSSLSYDDLKKIDQPTFLSLPTEQQDALKARKDELKLKQEGVNDLQEASLPQDGLTTEEVPEAEGKILVGNLDPNDLPPFLKGRKWDGQTISSEDTPDLDIPTYVRDATEADVLGWDDGRIALLEPKEVLAISDEKARAYVEARRGQIKETRKFAKLTVQSVAKLTNEQLADLTEDQIDAVLDRRAKQALRQIKDIYYEDNKYADIDQEKVDSLSDDDVLGLSNAQINAIKDSSLRGDILDKRRDLYEARKKKAAETKARFEGMTIDEIGRLSDDELLAVTDDQKDSVQDLKAKSALTEKIKIAHENVENKRKLEAIKDYVDTEVSMDTIYTNIEQIPGFDTLPKPLQEVLRAKMVNKDALRKIQKEGDPLKVNEEATAKRLEDLKLAKKKRELFFRQSRFIIGGVLAGAALGAMLSGGGDIGNIIAFGTIGLGGGIIAEGIDEKFGIDRAKIENEIAKSKSKIHDNQENFIRLKDQALKRDVSALTAFSTIAGEVFARGSGITDEAQRKRFIGHFQREMGISVMNAILAI